MNMMRKILNMTLNYLHMFKCILLIRRKYIPTSPYPDMMEKWQVTIDRPILKERNIDVDQFNTKSQIVNLLEDQNVLHTVTKAKAFSPLIVKEFYVNLTPLALEASNAFFLSVFLKSKWYKFSPT